MPVPAFIPAMLRHRKPISLPALLLLVSIPLLAARNPDPALRIPLEPIGFQQPSTQFLLAGSSMYTLHYVDDKHLLLTYSTHRLLKRLPDEPPEDKDRYVEAVLIELPSGHVLGRTQWRLHDHGQYLWSLGHGCFLLRVRGTLTTFAPVANLPSGQPFRERPFLTTDRRIGAVLLSPEYDLLILETMPPPAPKSIPLPSDPTPTPPVQQEHPDPAPVQINLFRISYPSADQIEFQNAGVTRARIPSRIAALAEGYLATIDQGRHHWAFDFHSYAGKTSELSPFDSSCHPAPLFVSRSEFVAFGCHGGNTFQVIGAFNLRGEEMWEQTVTDSYLAPFFVFAPASGRFALSRIISHAQSEMLIPELIGGQTVVVFQTDSGKQILRAEPLPVQSAGQNFTLSPDGMGFAILHDDAIEVYRLPPLTSKEQEAVKQARAFAPPTTDAPIPLSTSTANASPSTDSALDSSTETQTPNPQPRTPLPATNPAIPNTAQTTQNTTPNPPTTTSNSPPAPDEAQPEQPRKPPTLYNSPSDPPPKPTNQPQ